MPAFEHTTPEEIWKSIVGWEGIYSVSNLGRVRRDKDGRYTFPGRILKPVNNGNGYLQVTLMDRKSLMRTRNFAIHHLVSRAFLGSCPKGLERNHKNGIKTDNRAENLEYVTVEQNNLHALKTGLLRPPFGEQHYGSKLTVKNVIEIRQLGKQGIPYKQIASMFQIDASAISRICHFKRWKHIPNADES